MSKNKFIKKLLVAGLCALTATAMIGATACNKDNDGDNKGSEPEQGTLQPSSKLTITFNANGGTLNGDETVEVESGSKFPGDIPAPDAPEGYHFSHWADESGTIYVPGNTVITSNVTLKAVYVEDAPVVDLDTKQWLATSGTVDDTVEANAEVASNELFSASVDFAATYTTTTKPANAEFDLLDGESKQFASGLKSNDQFTNESGVVSFEAKADITLYAYVSLADSSYNGSRSGYVYYSVSGSDGAVMSANKITALSDAATTVKVDLKDGDIVSIYAYDTHASKANFWVFGAEAIENINPVTVNYYYGEHLIFRELVEDGATLTKPEDPVNGENKFLGWFADADCETEYTFGELAAGTTSVNIYADFQVSDVTIEYYLDKGDEEAWKTVNAFSGHYAEEVKADMKADGSPFLGWVTEDNQDFDWEHTALVAGTLKLYAKYGAAPTVGVEGTYTYSVTKESDGTYTTNCDESEGASTTAESLFTENMATAKDGANFKFGSGNDKLVLKIYVEEGSTITLNIEGYTGSSNTGSGIKATAATGDSVTIGEVTSVSFDGYDGKTNSTTGELNITSGAIVFTATDNGTVTITIERSGTVTAKLTKLEVVVARAAD